MNVMLRHIRMLCEFKGEFIGMKEARKHAAWYLKGMIGAAALRNEAGKLSVYRDIEILAEKVIRAGNES